MYCTRRKGHVGYFVTLSLFIFAQLSWYMSRIGVVCAYCYLLLVMIGVRWYSNDRHAQVCTISAGMVLSNPSDKISTKTLSGRVLIVIVRLSEE
ncbi:hypothetical protein H4582DRAFT_1960055 [Lactarius indigo]|nr:hypothetical protein H4582DRAFT_1960055 [Lactarius indigo]